MLRCMEPKAIIEIGSNSLKLLVAKTNGNKISPVLEKVVITRLSRGMKNHRIQEASLQKTLGILKNFLRIYEPTPSIKRGPGGVSYSPSIPSFNSGLLASRKRGSGSVSVRAFATAVLREAKNKKSVIAEIRRVTGLDVRVLSEREEAEYTCLGALSDMPRNKNARYAVIDIGGKSTEFAMPPDVFLSIPMGAVSLYEQFIRHDPPLKNEIQSMRNYISSACKDAVYCVSAYGKNTRRFSVIGAGGTFTTLASMKTRKVHHYKMPVKELERLFDKLCAMTIREKIEKACIEKGRADIIVPGAAIAIELLRLLGARTVTVSARGVRYGLLSLKS